MSATIVKPNQSALDIVLMACGTMEGAMAIMAASDRSISDDATAGDHFTVPADVAADDNNLQYLRQNQVMIGTKG